MPWDAVPTERRQGHFAVDLFGDFGRRIQPDPKASGQRCRPIRSRRRAGCQSGGRHTLVLPIRSHAGTPVGDILQTQSKPRQSGACKHPAGGSSARCRPTCQTANPPCLPESRRRRADDRRPDAAVFFRPEDGPVTAFTPPPPPPHRKPPRIPAPPSSPTGLPAGTPPEGRCAHRAITMPPHAAAGSS